MSNALSEIREAIHAHHDARAAAPDERARQRITNEFWRNQNERQRKLAVAFGQLNGWRLTKCFEPDDLGTCRHCIYEFMDHPLYYRDANTRCNVALVGQPYVTLVAGRNTGQDYVAALQAMYAAKNLRCHTPPNARASFHYPGWAVFVVVTKPDVTVRWLPEQIAWKPEPYGRLQ